MACSYNLNRYYEIHFISTISVLDNLNDIQEQSYAQ